MRKRVCRFSLLPTARRFHRRAKKSGREGVRRTRYRNSPGGFVTFAAKSKPIRQDNVNKIYRYQLFAPVRPFILYECA